MASSNLSCFHMAPTSEFKGHESIPFKGRDVGIFSFVILAISFIKILVFALKKLGFLVLVSLSVFPLWGIWFPVFGRDTSGFSDVIYVVKRNTWLSSALRIVWIYNWRLLLKPISEDKCGQSCSSLHIAFFPFFSVLTGVWRLINPSRSKLISFSATRGLYYNQRGNSCKDIRNYLAIDPEPQR